MRADVRDALYQSAAAELEHNGNYVALVSRALVEQGRTATVEVELRPWEDEPGMLDIILTDVSNQDSAPATERIEIPAQDLSAAAREIGGPVEGGFDEGPWRAYPGEDSNQDRSSA